MLSESGRRKRIWGSFPALRQVLETAPEPKRHAVPTSVCETVFEEINRLVTLANIAEEHKELIDALAHSVASSSTLIASRSFRTLKVRSIVL